MKPIVEAMQLVSVPEIQWEIEERENLMNRMVGSLYPAILQDEIFTLRRQLNDLQRGIEPVYNIIKKLNPKEVLVQSVNYLQYIDQNGKFCECQVDYKTKGWYSFETKGTSEQPIEIFINWIL